MEPARDKSAILSFLDELLCIPFVASWKAAAR